MHIAFYISSHGHGHAVRESFLINSIPEDVEVTIVTAIEHSFFEGEINRSFNYRNRCFDVGILQKDALTIDLVNTVDAMVLQNSENDEKLADEVALLTQQNVSLLISDSIPFVSELAKQAGISSMIISNFSWVDILLPWMQENSGVFAIVEEYQRLLNQFDYTVELAPAMESICEAGGSHLVGKTLYREGKSMPGKLHEMLHVEKTKKIALLYVGVYGLEEAHWEKLASYDGWHFISFYDLPCSIPNFTKISKGEWSLQDFSSSVDVVVAKIGYNTVVESLVSGVPLLYIPRKEFSESFVLEEYLERHGSAFSLSEEDFRAMQWAPKLETISACHEAPITFEPIENITTWILEKVGAQ